MSSLMFVKFKKCPPLVNLAPPLHPPAERVLCVLWSALDKSSDLVRHNARREEAHGRASRTGREAHVRASSFAYILNV